MSGEVTEPSSSEPLTSLRDEAVPRLCIYNSLAGDTLQHSGTAGRKGRREEAAEDQGR